MCHKIGTRPINEANAAGSRKERAISLSRHDKWLSAFNFKSVGAGEPAFFDLTTPPEAASCRACRVIGKAVWIPNARRHGFIHLDNLLSQRARRPFGLRCAPLFYYLPFSQESETGVRAGRSIREIAGRHRAVAHL